MAFVNDGMRKLFFKLGKRIANRPLLFIAASIWTSLLLGSGLVWLEFENDFEKIFSTKGGSSEKELSRVNEFFPSSDDSFDPSRRAQVGSYTRVIVEARDGGSLFRSAVWTEMLELDDLVQSASPVWRQNYSSLCGKWDGQCFENTFLELGHKMAEIENGSLAVDYPLMFDLNTFTAYAIPIHFGGIRLSNDSLRVEAVRAANLYYFLAPGTDVDDGFAWEQKIIDDLDYARPHWKHIAVYHRSTRLERLEHLHLLNTPMPYFSITLSLMALFLCSTAMRTDAVRSKPWAALLGVLCTNLGTIAGMGLVSFMGVPAIQLVSTVPFIMIGIGIDDTFVLLAAWSQTNPLDDVPTRLAHCYAEAGVSITITTLTDMLSFYVGLMTPVEGIQIFSAYAGTCVFCIYVLQVFMLGGCLAIGGRQEAQNKHGLFWWIDATPKSKSDGMSKLQKLFFTGGVDRSNPTNSQDQSESGAMLWFKTSFSTCLTNGWVKAGVIGLYLGYIAVSCYGLTKLETGLNMKTFFQPDSPIYIFSDKEEQYFQDYPYRVQVLITSPLDYFNETVQHQVTALLSQMNATGHIALEYSDNWLEAYNLYLEAYSDLFDLNVTDSQSFIDTLRGHFLNGSSSAIREDVKFNRDFTQIIASRFILQSRNGSTSDDLRNLAVDLRAVAENQTDFPVSVFSPRFATTDMDIIIESLTCQLMGVAAAVVMAVTILFLPSLICSLIVFVMMLSTELGVLGVMALWGLHLDMLSLNALVVCIGFAVDFTAHVSYAYISSDGSSETRLRQAMYSLGYPVLQGGLSTLLAVSVLFFFQAYSLQVLAKVVTLVIGFAAFHGLLVLPVFLLIFQPERMRCATGVSGKSRGSFDLKPS